MACFLANGGSERVSLLQAVIGQNAIEETDAYSRMTLMNSKTARFCRTVFQCSGAQGIKLMRKQRGGISAGPDERSHENVPRGLRVYAQRDRKRHISSSDQREKRPLEREKRKRDNDWRRVRNSESVSVEEKNRND